MGECVCVCVRQHQYQALPAQTMFSSHTHTDSASPGDNFPPWNCFSARNDQGIRFVTISCSYCLIVILFISCQLSGHAA